MKQLLIDLLELWDVAKDIISNNLVIRLIVINGIPKRIVIKQISEGNSFLVIYSPDSKIELITLSGIQGMNHDAQEIRNASISSFASQVFNSWSELTDIYPRGFLATISIDNPLVSFTITSIQLETQK